MSEITAIITIVGEATALVGVLVPGITWIKKLAEGQKCQLRSEMLQIYYRNRETKIIHQYEYENFILLYEAYKALKGNSFIDKIYKEIQECEIVN